MSCDVGEVTESLENELCSYYGMGGSSPGVIFAKHASDIFLVHLVNVL